MTDAGRYACQATNAGGMAEAVAEVIVKPNGGTPVLRPSQREQTAYVGASADLKCNVAAASRSPIRWTKDNGPLPATAIPQGNTLKFISLRLSDTGRYTCINDEGSDYVDLTVEGKDENAI